MAKQKNNKKEKAKEKEFKNPLLKVAAAIGIIAIAYFAISIFFSNPNTFKQANAPICTIDGKPAIRLFSTSWCPHCQWIKNTFDSNIIEYAKAGKITAYHWELDTGDNLLTPQKETRVPADELKLYAAYDPEQSVPAYIFGCKYYRIGNGVLKETPEALVQESKEFKSVIEKLLNAETNK